MSLTDLFFHAYCMQNEEDIAEFGKQYYYYISNGSRGSCGNVSGKQDPYEKGILFAKYVRNIHEGKGIQNLFYEMIYQLARVNIGKTCDLLEKVPYEFGTWKDLKKIAQYMYDKTNNTKHAVILHIIWIINRQVSADWNTIRGGADGVATTITNVSKWIPRESRCFWLYYSLAFDWAANYEISSGLSKWVLNKQPPTKAIENKICMVYRKIISELNRRNGTVEIHLCNREYQKIKPTQTPLLAFNKYKRLFLDYYRVYPEPDSNHKHVHEVDMGANHVGTKMVAEQFSKMTYEFKAYLGKFFSPGEAGSHGKGGEILRDPIHIRLGSLVKEAVLLIEKKTEKNYLDLFSNENTRDIPMKINKKLGVGAGAGAGVGMGTAVDVASEDSDGMASIINIDNMTKTKDVAATKRENKMDALFSKFMNMEYSIHILNSQWDFFMKRCPPLDNFIPFLDVSLDMHVGNRQLLYDAIGIACAISTRSTIPNRIMTVDHIPNWIMLPERDSVANHEFVSVVKIIMQSFTGNTVANLHASFDLLALSFLNSGTKPHTISETTVVVISNFAGFSRHENIHESLVIVFKNRGIDVLPHIVYWNVGGGMDIVIPCNTDTVGASLQSGNSLTDVCHLSYIDRTDTAGKNVENMISFAGS